MIKALDIPIEQLQYDFNTAIKCKISWKISWYEIINKYDDCNYSIKIKINDNVYYTNIFHNNKACTLENNKKNLDELYPKWKEVEVIVNAEQDYIFLADKSTEYIKYDNKSIWYCTNNFIKQEINTTNNIYSWIETQYQTWMIQETTLSTPKKIDNSIQIYGSITIIVIIIISFIYYFKK